LLGIAGLGLAPGEQQAEIVLGERKALLGGSTKPLMA